MESAQLVRRVCIIFVIGAMPRKTGFIVATFINTAYLVFIAACQVGALLLLLYTHESAVCTWSAICDGREFQAMAEGRLAPSGTYRDRLAGACTRERRDQRARHGRFATCTFTHGLDARRY